MQNRIVALDSLRGLAACAIALLHLPFTVSSHLIDWVNIENLWLYTDFFFALSGYVIAASYQQRLQAGMSGLRFLLLRYGRLAPLHLAVMLAFILRGGLLEALASAGVPRIPPQFQAEDLRRIVCYVGMMQGFPQLIYGEWNFPSWTISAEFCAYILFNGLVAFCGRRLLAGLAATALLSSASYATLLAQPGVPYLDLYIEFGVLRAIGVFSIGAIVWNLQRLGRLPTHAMLEPGVVLLVTGVVVLCSQLTVLLVSPYLCALLVWVFAQEAGPVSLLLRKQPFRLLGMHSYSIYMTHVVLYQLAWDALTGARHFLGVGPDLRVALVSEPWSGDLLVLAVLAGVLCVSMATRRFIEQPAREWFRGLAGVRPVPARALA